MKWTLKGGENDRNKKLSIHFTFSLLAMIG